MSELFTPSTEINQYRIVKYLGSGLFAETYLATHTFLEIDRAIKVLHQSTNSPEMFANYKERYKQEWQLAAGIHHPNLVEVYDVFEKDDILLAVIEYAPNGTLKDILDQGQRQSEDWVVDVLRDCAHGLLQLHQLRKPALVHCYVNPKTIVFDSTGRAKISNFGRARSSLQQALQRDDDYDNNYQAPELLRKKVAPTSDVYSLGCVAFEMLTGISADKARVRSPRQLEPSVSEWLDGIVARMLSDEPCFSKRDAADPRKRYADMEQVLEVLDGQQQQLLTSQLRKQIEEYFSMNDLKNLCADLGVDGEIISGDNKSAFAREIIQYFQHRGKTSTLIEKLREERPEVEW